MLSWPINFFTISPHKSPEMTQRYAHLRDEALKRASDLAGELIDQAAKVSEANRKVVHLENRDD